MRRIVAWAIAGCISTWAGADETIALPALTADQIIENNVAARGGLEAWRKIQTMIWVGHIDSSHAPAPSMPFVLEMKRPDKTRFEIKAQGQASVRIYDGSNGWKLRSTSSGKPELKQYSAEELSFAHDGPGIDGPLMDHRAKGIAVTLGGVDVIEGHKAYRLNLRLNSGNIHHVWIDPHTFLDIKYDREFRNSFGQSITASVFFHNYQPIEGLQIPLTIESGKGTGASADKLVIEKVLLNTPLEDNVFVKPNVLQQRKLVLHPAAQPQVSGQVIQPASLMAPEQPELAFSSRAEE
ncbi:MAG: hypothetical protein ABI475_07480 [Methylophilaceae bacterium]